MRAVRRAPGHLKPATKRWYLDVLADFALDPHHERLLLAAAESWDRYQSARQLIDRDGATYLDRWGAPKARPEVAIERDSRIAFTRCLRELALDIEPPRESRPPTRG